MLRDEDAGSEKRFTEPEDMIIMHYTDPLTSRQNSADRPALGFSSGAGVSYIAPRAEKSAPKPEDDTYSDEAASRRMDATVRATIAMKPKPRRNAGGQPVKLKNKSLK
jgi:hypothetical protein